MASLRLPGPLCIYFQRQSFPDLEGRKIPGGFQERATPPGTISDLNGVSPDATVSIGAVRRANPHVTKNANAEAGLPDSVPPTLTYEVLVTVDPPLSGPGQFVELAVVGPSEAGTAKIFPARITRTSTVTVTGGFQTQPGNAGGLQIRAQVFAGDSVRQVVKSAGFSVCAHPFNVNLKLHQDVNNSFRVGMIVLSALESDSGNFSDMGEVMWKEQVEEFHFDSPPFDRGSDFVNNSDYLAAIPPPGQAAGDSHLIARPAAGPKGEWQKVQLQIFKCARCGAADKVIPRSGFSITHRVFQVGSDWKYQVTKAGDEIGIKTFKAKAGSTSPTPIRGAIHNLKKS